MADRQRQRGANLGATFIPGGEDDFYMPTEVISPAPQRVTPEMPGKIQENLAHLELDATPSKRLSGLQSPAPTNIGYNTSNHNVPSRNSSISNLTTVSEHVPLSTPVTHARPLAQVADNLDQPTFSHFPRLSKRPVNVPPSDDEKEGILEKARVPVLNSNDPEVQLTWAQDALIYVEVAAQNESRSPKQEESRPQTPQIEHQLRTDAISVVSFLADQHHPKAEFLKGTWLEFGKFGLRMDKKEAFRCYQRSSQRGYPRAEYRMGMQFESSNEPEKAIKHYNLGVQQGDSASNYRLGMMILLGQHGQTQDYDRGIKLISYAAETADENAPQGAYVFGMLQARELLQVNLPERCLALNISGARYNIEKAAYLGFAKAQAKMGSAYELCQLGCAFDPALSLHYNSLAARQGEPDAEMAISKWFLCGYEGVFEKNEELAFTYAQRAAQNGLATAEFAVGYFYEVGIHVRPDLTRSRIWYEKAAEQGNKDAMGRIDSISRSKTLSRKDHENVAVTKIQSQYGSQRGTRPDRFKNSSTPMPTIPDDYNPIEMPEPKLATPGPGEYRPSPYSAPSPQELRPPSVAPYPVHDSPGFVSPRPPAKTQYSNPNIRNQSQFPSASPVESETSFGDTNYRGSAFPTFKPTQRPQPYTSLPGPAGRGGPPPPHGNLSGQGSIYRKPSPAVPGPQPPTPSSSNIRLPTAPAPVQTPSQPLKVDIGFSAPPDLSGADRLTRILKPPKSPSIRPPGSNPPRVSSQDSIAVRPQDRISSLPHPSSTPVEARPSSPHRRPMSAGRPSPLPPAKASNIYSKLDGASLESHAPPKLPTPSQAAATPPPSTSAAKPPGKGPKTFTEMGLPPSKQDNDCVVM